MRVTSVSLVIAAFASCASLSAQSSLSTITPFNANNAGGNGGVVWFDLAASFHDVEVTSIDINCNTFSGGPIQITTLINPNGYAGNTGDPSGWINIGTSVATAAAFNTPSSVVLNYPICVNAQSSVGVGLIIDSGGAGFGHAYTSGASTVKNADLLCSSGEAANVPFGGTSVVTPNLTFHYNSTPGVTCSQSGPANLAAVAEAVPGSGTLSGADSDFYSGQNLRWNIVDQFGNNAGLPCAVVLNFGSTPATTPSIPGFEMRWSGSTPSGAGFLLPPHMVGAADHNFLTPSGPFFSFGDVVRIQGLILDPAHALGSLGIHATETVIAFTNAPNCQVSEGFEGLPTGVGNYPTGWSDGGGDREWRTHSGGTGSGGTGPSGASEGAIYMYTETSVAGTPTFIMNTDSYPAAGLTGVSFDLSRIGAAMGPLEVYLGDGSGWFPVTLASYTGPISGEWNTQYLPLPASLPANVQFQFHYTRGSSFTGDCSIDKFCVY